MDICNKKNQIQNLLNEIYSEYNRMNETKIQSKCETDLEMRTMISNIRSLESSSIEKDNRIKCLEKTVCDYEKIIEDLNSKLELKEEYDRENNRHDMVRTLSKDISEKDREIERLKGLLEFHKKEKSKSKEDIKDSSQLDSIIDTLSNLEDKKDDLSLKEVVEPVNKETGEENPNFIYDDKLKGIESEPSPDGSTHSQDDLNESIEHEEKSEPKEPKEPKEPEKPEKPEKVKTLMKVKKDKKQYFAFKEDDPIQDVYEYNEEKKTDKIVGKRTRVNGKWSWKLY
jgi:hypothetical protein